ncbi:hypothetical protein ACVWW5_006582 [Bradyrhizobium sp. LM3.4]
MFDMRRQQRYQDRKDRRCRQRAEKWQSHVFGLERTALDQRVTKAEFREGAQEQQDEGNQRSETEISGIEQPRQYQEQNKRQRTAAPILGQRPQQRDHNLLLFSWSAVHQQIDPIPTDPVTIAR